MLQALIIDHELDSVQPLVRKLKSLYPDIAVTGNCSCLKSAYEALNSMHLDLIFLDTSVASPSCINFTSNFLHHKYEVIFTSSGVDHAIGAVQYQVCGYLLKPVQDQALSVAIEVALKRIEEKEQNKRDKFLLKNLVNRSILNEVIGIPTTDGLEFVGVNEIIRCEGLQKCTRIVIKSRRTMISAYNIGEFRKLLEPFRFFAPHKSHLINLKCIKRYCRDGTITMIDQSKVPVARRRRTDFLNSLVHI